MKKLLMRLVMLVFLTGIIFAAAPLALAHDGWVQSNSPLVRVGDMSYLDLQFGNHGNNHRDYKLINKWRVTDPTFNLKVHTPNGGVIDLKSQLTDLGTTSHPGYFVSSFKAEEKGAYIAEATQTAILTYPRDPGPHRSIKYAKTVVTAVNAISADENGNKSSNYNRLIGQELEIVPLSDPAQAHEAGEMTLQVLYQGQPLPDAHVSMTPRSNIPPAVMGPPYDMMTDMEGKVTFELQGPDYYLFNVHHTDNSQTAPGYTYTAHGAVLAMIVTPELHEKEMKKHSMLLMGIDADNWQLLTFAGVLQAGIMFGPRAARRIRNRSI